nr:hypothetical protein [Tanacetum cinerariifolium]
MRTHHVVSRAQDQDLYRVLRFYSLFGGFLERLKIFSWLRFGIQEVVLGCVLCFKGNLLVMFCLATAFCLKTAFCFCVLKSIAFCLCVLKSLHFVSEGCDLSPSCVLPLHFDDQAIQTILLGLLEDVYAAVDSCETAKEIWERVRKMMKGSDIGEQEKKAKLFNEWEKFTSTDGESIGSYYHCFMQLMNDLKRKKHFPEHIAANLKFLNNLQPE